MPVLNNLFGPIGAKHSSRNTTPSRAPENNVLVKSKPIVITSMNRGMSLSGAKEIMKSDKTTEVKINTWEFYRGLLLTYW